MKALSFLSWRFVTKLCVLGVVLYGLCLPALAGDWGTTWSSDDEKIAAYEKFVGHPVPSPTDELNLNIIAKYGNYLTLHYGSCTPDGFSMSVFNGPRETTTTSYFGLFISYYDPQGNKYILSLAKGSYSGTLRSTDATFVMPFSVSHKYIRTLDKVGKLGPIHLSDWYPDFNAKDDGDGNTPLQVAPVSSKNDNIYVGTIDSVNLVSGLSVIGPNGGIQTRTTGLQAVQVSLKEFSGQSFTFDLELAKKNGLMTEEKISDGLIRAHAHGEGWTVRIRVVPGSDNVSEFERLSEVVTTTTSKEQSPVETTLPASDPRGVPAGQPTSEPQQLLSNDVYEGIIEDVNFNFQIGGGGADVKEVYVRLKELPQRQFIFTSGLATKSGLMTLKDLGGGFVQGPYLQGVGWKVRIRVVQGSDNVSEFENLSEVPSKTTNADVNAKDSDGATPLHEAALNGNTENVKLLLDKGADVNAKDTDGWTPLLLAAANGHTETVKLLIDKGADVNAKTSNGATPLHWAAFEGNTENVKLLIEKGADVNAKGEDGFTPLGAAKAHGHTQIVKFLRQHGGKE